MTMLRSALVLSTLGLLLPAAARPEDGPPSMLKELGSMVARPEGLLPDEVATRAMATSFVLKQGWHQVAAAAAAVEQARLAWLPRVGVAARYARLSDITQPPIGNVLMSPGAPLGPLAPGAPVVNAPVTFAPTRDLTEFKGSLGLPLSDYLWRIPQANAAAGAARTAAEFQARAQRAQIGADARILYYTWATTRLQTVVAREALEQSRRHLASAQRAFTVGGVPRVDVLRVEAQVASAERFLIRALDLEALLQEQLRTVMHDSGSQPLEIGADLRGALSPLETQAVPALVEEAWRQRLEVRAIEEAVAAQRAQVQVARAAGLPSLQAFGEVTDARPNQRYVPPQDRFDTTWSVGVSLTYAINDSLNAAAAGRGAAAQLAVLEDQRAALRDQLRIEVAQALQLVGDSDGSVDAALRGQRAAEAALRSRAEQYAQGRATSVELSDAEQDFTQASLAVIATRVDQRVGRVRLSHALGRDLATASD
jgi:outer membrane protein TolC